MGLGQSAYAGGGGYGNGLASYAGNLLGGNDPMGYFTFGGSPGSFGFGLGGQTGAAAGAPGLGIANYAFPEGAAQYNWNPILAAQQQQLAQQQAQAQGPTYSDNLQNANYLQMANQGYPNIGGNAGQTPGYQPQNVQYPTMADQTKQVATGQPTIGGQGGLPPDYGTATPDYRTSNNVSRTNQEQAQHIEDLASQMGISVQEAYNLYGGQMATAYEEAYDPLLQATTEGRQFLLDAARRSSETTAAGYQQAGGIYGQTGQNITAATSAMTEPWRSVGAQSMYDLYNLTGTNVAEPGQYQQSPGYQFQIQQGANTIQQAAAARGGLQSGKTLQDLTTFAEGTAAQDYNNWWNQQFQQKGQQMGGYGQMAGLGAELAGQTAALNQQTGLWSGTGQAGAALGAAQATAAGQQAYGDISAQSGQQYAQYLSDMIMGGRSAQAGAGLAGSQAFADIIMSGAGLQSNYLSNAALAQAQRGGGDSAIDWASLFLQGAGLFF